MTLPKVLMCSMWKDDQERQIVDRVEHLLAKCESYPNLAYLWVVGDSADGTAQTLRDLTVGYDNVTILDIGCTGIEGDDPASRLRRLSVTGNHYLMPQNVGDADYILVCESDIQSPYNLVNLLVAHALAGRCPIAAWPTLEIRPGERIFYDTFCYRKDGVRFGHHSPYHPCYKPDRPFTVDSAGTVLMFCAEDAPEVVMSSRAILDLCSHLREMGLSIWVDPTLEVVQPHSLWNYVHITKEYAG